MNPLRQREVNYGALGLKDLLEAREAYHVHLSRLENVVATAVGRNLIRLSDLDLVDGKYRRKPPPRVRREHREPRTLSNSTVTEASWPCVLVFVDPWVDAREFVDRPGQFVPRTLHLPDGRAIPTCVVAAGHAALPATAGTAVTLPSTLAGGGYLALSEVQGRQRTSTVGCLVTDGDRVFVLTNRHVAGTPGRELGLVLRGKYVPIGTSTPLQVTKLPFAQAYPGWPEMRAHVNLDVGLVEIADVSGWTAQVYGIGTLGAPVNLHTGNLTVDLVGLPVRAHGGASGALEGEIKGLFYRYGSMAGLDYVSDFLIGSRTASKTPLRTLPGDSGTVWVVDGKAIFAAETARARASGSGTDGRAKAADPTEEDPYDRRPIAVQWGGHARTEGATGEVFSYALATSLATVCRVLDVDVVRDWNVQRLGLKSLEYWGEVGHYTIGGLAVEFLPAGKLRTFLGRNRDRISFDESKLGTAASVDLESDGGFFPLSDVPDTVWRMGKHSRSSDKGSHHADMDDAGSTAFPGQTLFDLCEDPRNVHPTVWDRYFTGLVPKPAANKRGSLPFRVWQLFDLMVAAARDRDAAEFLGVAGVLAHYVGDACQPLHSSRYHDGDPDDLVEKTVKGKVKLVPRGSGVHSAYETAMLNRKGAILMTGVRDALGAWKAPADVGSGHEAAVAAVALMREAQRILPPKDVVDFYVEEDSSPSRLWAEFQDETTAVVAAGTRLLARLWTSAWKEGGGASIAASKLKKVAVATLEARYESKAFAPSWTLPDLAKKTTLFPLPP